MQAESCMVCREWDGSEMSKEWEWLSCSNKEEGVAVVAVHKVKQGVAADGGRYWRCGEPQHIRTFFFCLFIGTLYVL